MSDVCYRHNAADEQSVLRHLIQCDASFEPPLSSRVSLDQYAMKLARFADRFEAWSEEQLVGLVAAYLNEQPTKPGFISSVSVLPSYRTKSIGAGLLTHCLRTARTKGFDVVELDVASSDERAQRTYRRLGFHDKNNTHDGFIRMSINLSSLHE
jgi:ribosomal-protein-alanine N-acetyltransferase